MLRVQKARRKQIQQERQQKNQTGEESTGNGDMEIGISSGNR